jgi:Protein of unknown function (DUF4232)
MLLPVRSTISGLALALGIGVTLITLSSCSSSASSSPPGTLGQAATATAVASSPTRSTAGTGGTTCQTNQLALGRQGDRNGLGNFAVLYGLQNTSQQTCTLDGYPGIRLLDTNQQPMTFIVNQQTSAYLYNMESPQLITLAPGQSGYFVVEWSAGPASCAGAAYVMVTPPGDQTSLQIADMLEVCTGPVIVSPIGKSPFS